MPDMNTYTPNQISSRRFLLLPEEQAQQSRRGMRIRRYRLTSVSRRAGMDGVDMAAARIARELGRLGRM